MTRPTRRKHFEKTACAFLAAAAFLASSSDAHSKTGPLASNVTCNPGWYVGTSNGRVQHPEIHVAFWQDKTNTGYQWETWSRYANNPSLSALVGASLSITNSPYYSKLAQYGTYGAGSISRARLSPYAPVWTGPPNGGTDTTASFTYGAGGDIENVVKSLVGAGSLPAPIGTDNTIYVVFLPSTASTTACGNVNGCNGPCSIESSNDAYCVYVKGNYTNTFTHETAEAISAWEGIGVNGCTYNPPIKGINPGQIGDLCSFTETQNSFSVASYWSIQDNECVIPESFGELYENDDRGAGWFAPSGGFNNRQMYGGGGGVVATSAVENGSNGNSVYFYEQGGGSWYGRCASYRYPFGCSGWVAEPIGNGGSEFAAGGSGSGAIVAGISLDTQYGVFTYPVGKGLGQAWTSLGSPNQQPVTSVQVTSNGTVVVTDQGANPWYWNGSSWLKLGGPGDQFVAWGRYILGLNPSHNDVFMIAPGNGGWSQETYNLQAAGLVAGADALNTTGFQGGWGMYQPGSSSFTAFGIGTSMTGSGSDFAFTENGAYMIEQTPYSDVVNQCTISGSCSGTNGVGGRLVSGNEMYVTGCTTGIMPCANLCEDSGGSCTSNGNCCSNSCSAGACL